MLTNNSWKKEQEACTVVRVTQVTYATDAWVRRGKLVPGKHLNTRTQRSGSKSRPQKHKLQAGLVKSNAADFWWMNSCLNQVWSCSTVIQSQEPFRVSKKKNPSLDPEWAQHGRKETLLNKSHSVICPQMQHPNYERMQMMYWCTRLNICTWTASDLHMKYLFTLLFHLCF